MSELLIDEERLARYGINLPQTGIYVRAKLVYSDEQGERYGSFDISALTLASLKDWLRSRGGFNPWAEQIVAAMLQWPAEAILEMWPSTEAQ